MMQQQLSGVVEHQRSQSWLGDLPIKTKTGLAALLMLLCLLLMGAQSYLFAARTMSGWETLSERLMARQHATAAISSSVARTHLQIYRLVASVGSATATSGDGKNLQTQQADSLDAPIRTDLEEISNKISKLASQPDWKPEEQQSLSRLASKWRNCREQVEDALDHMKSSPDLAVILVQEADGIYRAVESDFVNLSQSYTDAVNELRGDLVSDAQQKKTMVLIIIGIATLISVLVMYWVNLAVVRPILQIRNVMQHVRDGDVDVKVPLDGRKDEIGQMAESIEVFRRGMIERQRTERKLSNELRLSNELMADSIRYASRIQRALLPSARRVGGRFEAFEVIWEPKDVVGGDFYWVSQENADQVDIAVVDCTGHGVPGAMMTMLVGPALERLHESVTGLSPGSILSGLDRIIRGILDQGDSSEGGTNDGFDAALARIDEQRKIIRFSAAHMSLLKLQGDGLCSRVAGERKPLGYPSADSRPPLQETEVSYKSGERFVLYSDGITDQVGGPRALGLGHKGLATMLSSCNHQEISVLRSKVGEALKLWQGDEAQRDDWTLLIFEPKHR
jgi:serine phosphatase RsbU (regulator of sigma subunit)/HAMP domain-containing protein